MKLALILSTMLLVALAAPAFSAACTPTTSNPEYDTLLVSEATGTSRYYGDDDCFAIVLCQLIIMSFWVYEESNGIDGLQRDDEVHDDTCGGAIPGDTIIL